MLRWINLGPMPKWLNVARVIETYSGRSGGRVRYLGELGIRLRRIDGELDEQEKDVCVFWQEKLIDPAHSHYFAIYLSGGAAVISDGSDAEGSWLGGTHPETGEVIFSRFRHDFRKCVDGSFFCDGGRQYFRRGGHMIQTKVELKDGNWSATLIQEDDDAATDTA
jgi:hypothetical protein